MKVNTGRIIKRKRYTESYKKSLVRAFESGRYTVKELSRFHQVNPQSIYSWIYRYSLIEQEGYRIVEKKESTSAKVKALHQRIKELEQLVGQKQIQLEYYQQMLDLAEEHYNIDIKKNSDTPPSKRSKQGK